MPASTARSSTEARTAVERGRDVVAEARRATADVGPLLRLRISGLAGSTKRRLGLLGVLVGMLTLVAATVPAWGPGAGSGDRAQNLLLFMPSAYLGVLFIAVVSATASGGGRELLARDEAVAFPVSPTTDHLGSLLMAPLNVAWLLQAWVVLGATAYVLGPERLLLVQLPVVLWIAVATAGAQVVAWSFEWLRRTAHGGLATGILLGLLAALAVTAVAAGAVTGFLDRAPTVRIVLLSLAGRNGDWAAYAGGLGVLAALALVLVVLGAVPAHRAARRAPHEETALETSHHPARPLPGSDLRMVLRIDRAGIWRSVPLRRGVAVLALIPGGVALAGGLGWDMLLIMPGLVASGGALLFGVNAWCLDGRGGLWRETLPLSPRLGLVSRAIVLIELLVGATVGTLLLASLRAGVPSLAELVALVSVTAVVAMMVTARVLQWSVERPYATDLRSARATPAPPTAMFGYSIRLAAATTMVSLLFTGVVELGDWRLPLLVAVPFLLFSTRRLVKVARAWEDHPTRARVLATVAG
ncbi:MAG: hypothetical protein Q8Q02_14165 [Nocardioides sp.]|nr:hypothetical protein [Nocardioides sp.]